MNSKKHEARVNLAAAADRLVAEVWSGEWDHIPEVKSAPFSEWLIIPRELERRCAGHSLTEYREAIWRNWVNRR